MKRESTTLIPKPTKDQLSEMAVKVRKEQVV
jgi:hypothetical protein